MKFRILIDEARIEGEPTSWNNVQTLVKGRLLPTGPYSCGVSISGQFTLWVPGNQIARFYNYDGECEIPLPPEPAREMTDVERAMKLVQQASDAIPFGAGDGIRDKLCDAHKLLRKVAAKPTLRKVVLDNGWYIWSDKAIGEYQEMTGTHAFGGGGRIVKEL